MTFLDASPRAGSAGLHRPYLPALLLLAVAGGSLWTLLQRNVQSRSSPFAAREINLQALAGPLPQRAAALPLSSHKCTNTRNDNHRVCEYSNLILHGGTVYYLTDDPDLELPIVDVTYHPADDEKFAPTVLQRSAAAFLLPAQNKNEWASIPLSWLWKVTKRWDNLAHHFGEDAVTLHHTLCSFLGECRYPPRREVQLLLLHSREQGALLSAVNATLARCATGSPAVFRDDVRLLSKTVLLEKAWSGIGPQCHAQRGCASDSEFGTLRGDKRASMPPAALQSWRERLGACYGFDVRTPAQTRPKNVLIVDRPYEAGRHMLNIRSVEKFVQQRFPEDVVRVQYFEDVPFPEQLRIMSRVSLLVMVHGSAIALWPFLPPGAVAIHISPDVESNDNLQRVWADHYARDWGFTGLSYVPVNNTEPSRQHMRWERLVLQDGYKTLTDQEKLALLEQGECPDKLSQLCTFHWKRQELSLVLNLDDLAWALDMAESELLRKAAGKPPLLQPPQR
ncbi:hypothetical protein ABPG75_003946 [Micractinium tetrahymenae]